MSFFKKLFSSSSENNTDDSSSNLNERSFGRYTEVNKTSSQLVYWSKALDEFSQKKYIDSFNSLLLYMLDPKINNVKINKNAENIVFEIIQGSKIIRGKADNKTFEAEAMIARFDKLSVAFLRKLMGMNFINQYTRFAIKDDIIYLKFDSNTIDASPNKVYFSIKELSLKSDKLDDSLIDEFESLHPVDCGHIIELDNNIKEIKYKYLIKWINDTLNKVYELNEDRMSGGISYMLLALIFRIDYLLQPQGTLFDAIDKINGIYNAKDNKTTLERNRLMIEELKKILNKPKDDIISNFYDVKTTFGYVPVTSHKQFYEFILEQFKNTGWYYENKYDGIVTSIYEWVIGYSLFYFGLYPATYDLLKIAYMILQPDFFKEMGITLNLNNSNTNIINKAALDKEIQKVIKNYIKHYPKLTVMVQNINCRTMNEFLYTFLNEITYLNFSK